MEKSKEVFRTPLSGRYWKLAAMELKYTRILVLAAVLTAMRIAIKSLSIPIGPNLNITFGFIFNAVGSMIYGPVVAILTSAISDTLGAILFPTGTYFFPFIFEEIAGGVIFALFYYRAKLSSLRIIMGRFAVTVIVNLMINPFIMYYYYLFVLGKSYEIFTLPKLIKNLALFPVQSLILVVLFNAVLPFTKQMGLTYHDGEPLQIRKKDVIVIIVLTVLSAAAIAGYYWYKSVTA